MTTTTPIYHVTCDYPDPENHKIFGHQTCVVSTGSEDLLTLRQVYLWIEAQRELYPTNSFTIYQWEHKSQWFTGNGKLLAQWTIAPTDNIRQFI